MVNNYINIIAIFYKKHKIYKYFILVSYVHGAYQLFFIIILFWCLTYMAHINYYYFILVSYVHGAYQLFLLQNNSNSFLNKTTPTDSVNNGKLLITLHKSMLPSIFSRLSESETLQSLGNTSDLNPN